MQIKRVAWLTIERKSLKNILLKHIIINAITALRYFIIKYIERK